MSEYRGGAPGWGVGLSVEPHNQADKRGMVEGDRVCVWWVVCDMCVGGWAATPQVPLGCADGFL